MGIKQISPDDDDYMQVGREYYRRKRRGNWQFQGETEVEVGENKKKEKLRVVPLNERQPSEV